MSNTKHYTKQKWSGSRKSWNKVESSSPMFMKDRKSEFKITNFQMMVQLVERQKNLNYKNNWVYHKFIEAAQYHITYKDFEKLAKLLGYSKGWAYHKSNDWKDDLRADRTLKKENDKQYARDRRYSEIKPNENF